MNKRQYKKMKKTKVERDFMNYLKENYEINVSDRDKTFYIFKIKSSMLYSANYKPFMHLIKYMRSIGMRFAVVPHEQIDIESFISKSKYIDYLKKSRDTIDNLIQKYEKENRVEE